MADPRRPHGEPARRARRGATPAAGNPRRRPGGRSPRHRDGNLLERLRSLGYDNPRSGNRFEKNTGTTAVATIDLLVPSYTSSHVPNLDAGPIAVDGIPALHVALARPPVSLTLHVATSASSSLATTVQLPELPAAIAVKTFAYISRRAPRDAADLHRLLEAAYLTGVQWPSGPTFREASDALTRHFDSPGHGLRNVASDSATRTRMRALVPIAQHEYRGTLGALAVWTPTIRKDPGTSVSNSASEEGTVVGSGLGLGFPALLVVKSL